MLRGKPAEYALRSRESKAELAAQAVAAVQGRPPQAETVGELLDAYLSDVYQRATPGAQDVESAIHCWLAPAFSALPVDGCDVRHVVALVQAMERAGLANNTIRTKVSFLRSAFAHAAKIGIIKHNSLPSLRGVLPPKQPRPDFDPGVLTLDEVGRVCNAPRTPERARILYATAAATGCRVSELVEFRLSDIDWDASYLPSIHVARRWSRKCQTVSIPKGGKTRIVPLHPRIGAALQDWIDHGWRRLVGRKPCADDLLFPEVRPDLHRLNDRRVLLRWHHHLDAAGMDKRNFHALRHSFVTALGEVEVKREVIEQFTHPRNARPIDTYLKFSWRRLCTAIAKLELPPVILATQGELFPIESFGRRPKSSDEP